MRVAALMVIRNEVDIVATTVRYHRDAGITDFFVLDNGSSDGTDRVLAGLAAEVPGLRWTKDDGPFAQSDMTTELARQARSAGADWVVTVDADEFWSPGPRGFGAALAGHDEVGLEVQLQNFIQVRDVVALSEGNLATMTVRAHPSRILGEGVREAVSAGVIAYAEMDYPPKWIARADPDLVIGKGAHTFSGLEGPRAAAASITCLHAPLRARDVFSLKAEQGRRSADLDPDPETSWHLKRWAALEAEGRLETDWAANSYRMTEAGPVLDLPSGPVPAVRDTRLVDEVRPYLPRSGRRLFGRRKAR